MLLLRDNAENKSDREKEAMDFFRIACDKGLRKVSLVVL